MNLRDKGLFTTIRASSAERMVDLSAKSPGVHCDDEVFYRLDADRRVLWVVSRICDHSNGKLRLDANVCTATCPLHGWRLSLETLVYENVQLKKPRLAFRQEGKTLAYVLPAAHLELPASLTSPTVSDAEVRFLAHACVELRAGGLSLVTDPWLLGPCFATGWWHLAVPPADAMERLDRADAIYLSHNHPDHMHIETLRHLDRDKPLLIPDFETRSVEKIALAMGFRNLHILKFNHLYEIGVSGVHVSILPAGDFRDDSGLFVSHGDFSLLATVDANQLNQYILPRNLSLLMTSFAGGASGFPLCFENYSEQQKSVMLTRNRNAMLASVEKYVASTQPKAYMPYAGYFTEAAPRDRYIKENNKKNGPGDINAYIRKKFPAITVFDPCDTDILRWDGTGFLTARSHRPPLFTLDANFIAEWVGKFELGPDAMTSQDIVRYFECSSFQDNLLLFLIPCDDDFRPLESDGYIVDFRAASPTVRVVPAQDLPRMYEEQAARQGEGGTRLKRILVRQGPLYRVIRDRLPWEDLSIGFQCRVHRTPDVYNSSFWFHFTNEYVGELAGGAA